MNIIISREAAYVNIYFYESYENIFMYKPCIVWYNKLRYLGRGIYSIEIFVSVVQIIQRFYVTVFRE